MADALKRLHKEEEELEEHIKASMIRLNYLKELIQLFTDTQDAPGRLGTPKKKSPRGPYKKKKTKKKTKKKKVGESAKEVDLRYVGKVKEERISIAGLQGVSVWGDLRTLLRDNHNKTFTTREVWFAMRQHPKWSEFEKSIIDSKKNFNVRVRNAVYQIRHREKLINTHKVGNVTYVRWGAEPVVPK